MTFNSEKELLDLLEKLFSQDLGDLYQMFLDKFQKKC